MPEFTVVKLHLSGPLAGMKTGETLHSPIKEGIYTECVTGHKYQVTYCGEDFLIEDTQSFAADVWSPYATLSINWYRVFMAAYHTAVSRGAGPRTAQTLADAAASGYPL